MDTWRGAFTTLEVQELHHRPMLAIVVQVRPSDTAEHFSTLAGEVQHGFGNRTTAIRQILDGQQHRLQFILGQRPGVRLVRTLDGRHITDRVRGQAEQHRVSGAQRVQVEAQPEGIRGLQVGAQLVGLALLAVGGVSQGETHTTPFTGDRAGQAVPENSGHVVGGNVLGWLVYQRGKRSQHVQLQRAAYLLGAGFAAPFHIVGVTLQQLAEGALAGLGFCLQFEHIQLSRPHGQLGLLRLRFQRGMLVQVGDALTV
ncbi:hypothetical protein D3C71_1456790 [compost metagenome]